MIVGVVGAGTMGSGIAQLCLEKGHEVVLNDVDEPAIQRGRERVAVGLERSAAKGRLDGTVDELMGRLRDGHGLTAVTAESDLVIEAALEELGLKREIFRALDEGARPDVPLATNTSALSVTEIAAVCSRPERVLGLHFFNPAPLMPLVEVVLTGSTAPAIAREATAFVEGLGKTPVVCRDTPGFIVNRVNRPFTLEALRMLEAGEADVGAVDAAIEEAGYPMGPFRLMDLVGVDVNLAVATSLYEAFDRAERFRPSAIQARLVEAGQLGRKTDEGFWRYEESGAPERQGFGQFYFGEEPIPLAPEGIVRRIELAIINEAYLAAAEGVADPRDIDRAMQLGANHPYGPFERARELGLRAVVEGLQALEEAYGPRFRVAPSLWQIAHV